MKRIARKLASLSLAIVTLSSLLVFAIPVDAASNNLWAWGHNTNGQLGYSLAFYVTEPVKVSGLSDVIAVSVYASNCRALLKDGTVWGFGNNTIGQIGDATTTFPPNQYVPVQAVGLAAW